MTPSRSDDGATPHGMTVSARPLSALESLEAARADVLRLEAEIATRERDALQRAEAAEAARLEAETLVTQAQRHADEIEAHARTQLERARAHVEAANAEVAKSQSELARLNAQHGELQLQRDELARGNDELRAERETLTQTRDALAAERDALSQQRDALTRERKALIGERDALTVQRDRLTSERDALQSDAHALRAQISEVGAKLEEHREEAQAERERADVQEQRAVVQAEKTQQLKREIAELHHDLTATDAPTLILRAAMQLTGAEQGLFTDEGGERVISSVGFDDLPDEVRIGIFAFTKQALRDEQPIVRNDGENLPDGAGCVNLAALPVAFQNEATGAILVANKRSGPFDDDDTQVLISIGRHAGIALQNQKLHLQLEESYRATIAVLADAIEAKDPYTRGHCESVSKLAVAVAQELGCSRDELDRVRYAALLHDVGKIGVSDGVLLKPGKLLPEEFGLIQRHAAIGADLAKRVPALSQVVPLILHHHERIDGAGYPNGLEGDGIPLGARIIGAVDAFDAMTTPRPYRNPVEPDEALEEMQRCAGTQFDAGVVETLARVWREQFHAVRAPIIANPESVKAH